LASSPETTLDLDWDLINHLPLPESVDRLRAERVRVDLIEDDYTVQVYEWVMAFVRKHGSTPTAAVLEDQFEDLGLEPPQTVIDDLIGRLRLRYVKNQGREALDTLVEEYTTRPDELIGKMAEVTRELEDHVRPRGDLYSVDDVDRMLAQYDRDQARGRGASFGYEELDDHFHGQRGVTFMLGPPKSMKSWFTTRAVIANVAEGRRCAFFSLELPAFEADARIRCMAAGIPWWKYLKGALSKNDREVLTDVSEAMTDAGLYHVYHPEHGERQIDMMIETAKQMDAEVLFLDQLQYVETATGRSVGAKNDTGDYWEVCNRLRDLSDEIPIWVVHQFNRTVQSAEEMPVMQQIKGSAAIEETATTALGLWANKDMRSSNVVQMGTLASRNYEWLTWAFNVNFNRDCSIDYAGLVTE
jgi:replicative DNA helicase